MKKMLGVILLGMLITLFAGCSSSSSSSIPTTFTISGTVRGSFAANVTINLTSGVTTSTKTASDGTYSFTGLGNGFYTVTPVLTGYTFIPVSQEVIINGANVTGQIFAETLNSPTQYFGMWTWVSGPNTSNQAGSYGTIGDAATGNVPGARSGSVSWIDSSGNLWLFGGFGYDSAGNIDLLNDLWKFDGTNWTWVSGSNIYGAFTDNVPGARSGSVSWIDSSGNLWLFGGSGYDSAGNIDLLNDLWKFDSVNVNWTWVSGSKTYGQVGSYGTKGSAATGNVPGARSGSVSWIDSSGNLWLFGGSGYDSAGNIDLLNDLWKFDGTNWTWVSGSKTYGQAGSYGKQGSAAVGNVPGARSGSVSWIDSHGYLWLFGGWGWDYAGNVSFLNDLWKFDSVNVNWTWVNGSKTSNQAGSCGTKGVAATGNVPGARQYSISWIDSSDNLWLFGGSGYDSAGDTGYLNDLWKFDGANWTWVSGFNIYGQAGSYGTKGSAAMGNVPGARVESVSWIDSSGNLWLFGGFGYDSAGNVADYLNDLWRYQP